MSDENQKEQNLSACAHIHVERFQIEKNGRIFEEQWRCADCGTKFVTLDSLFVGPQTIQAMEPFKTLRDEFAMAALTGLLLTNYRDCEYPKGYGTESYKFADAMLKARTIAGHRAASSVLDSGREEH